MNFKQHHKRLKFHGSIFMFASLIVLLFNSDYRQNIKGMTGTKFCLDVEKTKKQNDIPVSNSSLTLNGDRTFIIVNDSTKFSNLKGHWDLCCAASDYGNYVFKVDGLEEWKRADPNMFVLVDNKKLRLFFTSCDKKDFFKLPYTDHDGCPKVDVGVELNGNHLKYGNEISVTITLTNKTNSTQDVWFDKPASSTGGPALTSVILTNIKTGRSVLKYQNKAALQSQVYTRAQVQKFSYHLKEGQKISGQFSLYDMVVLSDDKEKLDKGQYELEVFYCSNPSNKIHFSVH